MGRFNTRYLGFISIVLSALALLGLPLAAQSSFINRVAGTGARGFGGDGGPAITALLDGPDGVAVDPFGNVYIADDGNNRIRKVTPQGIISTIAGSGTAGFSGDGGPAALAQLRGPSAVAVDASGNVYIADAGNQRIRKVTAATGTITTVAGTGTFGFSGDGGPATAAQLFIAAGALLAVDGLNNLYIADSFNNRVRKVTANGVINTVAGTATGGFSGDGGAAVAAQLRIPNAVAVDSEGQLYILDSGNGRLRKVTSAGVISTVAGRGGAAFSGDGGPAAAAQFSLPTSVAVDTAGNVYVADTNNRRIRQITTDGIIRTVAGNGASGSDGDGGPAASAQLSGAAAVAVDGAGNFYIAEQTNNSIRKVNSQLAYFAQFGDGQGITSTAVLVNPSPALPAIGRVRLFDSDGNPLSVSINGAAQNGGFDFRIPPVGVSFVATSGAGSLTKDTAVLLPEAVGAAINGSVQVNSITPVGGTVLFAGSFGVAGVGTVQPAAKFFVPLELNAAAGIQTGVALSNPTSSQVNIAAVLHDTAGIAVPNGNVFVPLPANGQLARFASEIFAGRGIDFSNFRGILEINAASPINGMAIRVSPGEFATLPVTPAGQGSQKLTFAQFGNGAGILSTLILVNPSSTELANGTALLFDSNGNPLPTKINGTAQTGSFNFTVPPLGVAFYATDGAGTLTVGSAQVTSTVPIGGTILFSGSLGVEGVGAVQPSSDFLVPLDLDSSKGVQTGVAISNPTTAALQITLRLRDSSGALISNASTSIILAANGQLARFPGEVFQSSGIDFSRFQGSLEVISATPVVGMAIRVSPGQFATLPVTPLTVAAPL